MMGRNLRGRTTCPSKAFTVRYQVKDGSLDRVLYANSGHAQTPATPAPRTSRLVTHRALLSGPRIGLDLCRTDSSRSRAGGMGVLKVTVFRLYRRIEEGDSFSQRDGNRPVVVKSKSRIPTELIELFEPAR